MTDDARSTRDSYLIRGRRVLIRDLMQASLLEAGTDLVFRRPRLGETYTATVTQAGKLRLPDGREFASPSRAAVAAAGGSLDGWHAWQVSPNGESLDTLRQRLLDHVAGSDTTGARSETGSTSARAHHEFLRRARQEARDGAPMVVSVRELLGQWGATSRTALATEQLAADLENHGLTTKPSFLKTGIDSDVAIIEREIENTERRDDGQLADDSEVANGTDVGLTLGNIPSANGGIESITPQASYDEAITRMLLNDFSQLAVLTSPRSSPRAVTWQSIARERHANPTGLLSGAIVEASVRYFDTELIDVLPLLEAEDFVFVKDTTNLITGIVTTADVVRAYGELATPFFLIGELDRLLRQIISDNFTMAQVRDTCDEVGDRDLQSYDDLTMGDYERLLQDVSHWQALGWPLDRATFGKRLAELREVRNDLVHFNPDPVPEHTVNRIRQMLQVLRKYASA